MRKGWKSYKIGELSEIGRGSSPRPISDQKYFSKGNIPWVKIADATASSRYIYKTKNFLNEYGASFSRRLKPGTIILGASGTLGIPMYLGIEACIHDGWLYFKNIKKEVINKDYLFYFLETLKSYFNQLSFGAAIQNINTSILRNTPIFLPNLIIQNKVVTILKNYDTLIENNLKRIKLLEEQAQQTYEEWFVRFKFPSYEGVEIDEESGLPVGWERKKIEDVIEVGRGSSPRPISNQEYFEGGTIPWLKIADATASHIYIYETKQYVNEYGASFSRKLPIGSIVVAASGTLGFPMILGVEACIHDGWLYFKGIDDKLKEYFYFSFMGLRSYFESISYGAAIQNINTGIVRQSPFIIPSEDITVKFKSIVSKTFESISNLQKQNQFLKEARDILLPRLMSGMIDVDGLEVNEGLGMVAEEQVDYKIKR